MIKTLAKSIREFKKPSILAPVYIAGEILIETLLPFVMAMLIDSLENESMNKLLMYGAILIAMAFCSLALGILSAKAGATACAGFSKNLRKDMFYKVMTFSFSDMDHFTSSSLVTRMTTDVTSLQMAYGMIIRMFVRVPLQFIFAIIMGCTIHAKLTLIFIAIAPVLALAILFIAKSAHNVFRRIFKKYDAMNNSVQENVSAIRLVKGFVREEYEIEKFDERSDDVRREFTHAEQILALFNPVMNLCIFTGMLLLCFFGARTIVSTGATELTTGQLSSLMSYGVQILGALQMLGMAFVMMTMAGEAGNRVTEVLNFEPTLTNAEEALTEMKDGSIRFENVSFKYSEEAAKNALEDINLDIPSGSIVGIIGSTGSSKTTLIQLISRLYDATEGTVYVGGVDVRKYDLKFLRDQVAVVLQKNVLFAGTVKENMRWGKEDATDGEIIAACKAACADEFIVAHEDGYDREITQGGTNVSGGQKQRLCIARAILKNPKVLIMDDSTSAVDTKTDAIIRRNLREIISDTTKIIIAQRVSSVEDADIILVMNDGRIVEQGTSEELIALGGIYSEIYETQTKGKEE